MRPRAAYEPVPLLLLAVCLFVPDRCAAPARPRYEAQDFATSSSAASPSPLVPAESPRPAAEASASTASSSAAPASSPTAGRDALFESSIRPILASRCAPCHVPGGKMYARLPFDDPSVVAAKAAGISRRLKGDDLAALQSWIGSRK